MIQGPITQEIHHKSHLMQSTIWGDFNKDMEVENRIMAIKVMNQERSLMLLICHTK
jgi:lipid II:glycine glycyltransferase (peptidoglycan interpeptide bridge formation enzyme)